MEIVRPPQSLNEQLNGFVCSLIERGLTRDEATREFEKIYIVQLLVINKGNQCKAARQGGIHRNTLSRDIKLHKIDMERVRQLCSGKKRIPASVGHAATLIAQAG